jgi:hypothetical protein
MEMKTQTKFKPTLALEMDIMKTLLDNFEKLEQVLLEIEIADSFWLNQQNENLFLILKKEYFKTRKKKDFSIENYYKIVFSIAENTIPNFDGKVYEEFYEQDFKFSSTFLDYYQYFYCKKMVQQLHFLVDKFSTCDFEKVDIFDRLEQLKATYRKMLIRKM